jgi:hypothetical protein
MRSLIVLSACRLFSACAPDSVPLAIETRASASASAQLLTETWKVEGNVAFLYLGTAVASAGDVNADGFDDVLIGGPGEEFAYHAGPPTRGRAWLFYGSTTGLATTPDWSVSATEIYLGADVASAGDVNGDGFDDIVIGSPAFHGIEPLASGRVDVFHGAAAGPALVADWTVEASTDSELGAYVASAGDVNADGFDDVIFGMPSENRVEVYLGSALGLDTVPGWTFEGSPASSTGHSVSTAGDVNGDGFDDVIVGAPYEDGAAMDSGVISVWYGSALGLPADPSWTYAPSVQGARLGQVASAGDVNGDGFDDVAAGALSARDRALVFLGSAAGLLDVPWVASDHQKKSGLGHAIASAGDINGDGFDDLVVGAYGYDHGERAEGRVVVALGSANGLESQIAWSAESNQRHAMFGSAVASAGDVDADGFSDIIVGAELYESHDADVREGAVWLFNGGAP